MKRISKVLTMAVAGVMLMMSFVMNLVASVPVMADDGCNGTSTAIIGDGCVEDDGNGGGVTYILNLVVDIMTMGVGILGTLGIVVVGVQYLTAGGDEGKTRKAKQRILEIVIGMALFVALAAIIRFLNPSTTGTTSGGATSMTVIEMLIA